MENFFLHGKNPIADDAIEIMAQKYAEMTKGAGRKEIRAFIKGAQYIKRELHIKAK